MKKSISIFFLVITGFVYGQNTSSKYTDIMYKKLQILDTSRAQNTVINLFEDFKRISIIEKTQWLPYYYMAYCKIRLAAGEPSIIADETLDEAKSYLAIADSLNKNNSEILCLKSRIALSKIPLGNMIERTPKYAALCKMYVESAIEKDPKNPRAYLVLAMYYSFLPSFVGGNTEKACENLNTSRLCYKGKKRGDKDINMYWGEILIDDMIIKCKK